CPVQPPGRETRRAEPPLTSAAELARELADVVVEQVEVPFAVFGHSTGAVVAFELCRRLRTLGAPQPAHLFVSGRRAPQLPEIDSGLESMDLEQLARTLREHGGTPDWVIEAPGLLRAIHPLLAADFAVSERYRYQAEPPLPVPITAFAADGDPRADVAQLAAWREQSDAGFALHELAGGHFAVLEQAGLVHDVIAGTLTAPAGMRQL
ncbi:MAG: thioesterase II family protein, partial [Catenulispora sp.]